MTELLKRKFNAEASVGDGRTIDLRVVPYGEPTQVDDGQGPYMEQFERGAFDGQTEFAHRVYLNFQHEKGIRSVVGKGVVLESREDALYGTFRALPDGDGDKALTLVNEGILTGASVEFKPQQSIRSASGIIQRVKAHLDAVALCRVGAYASAGVLAVREDDDEPEQILDATLIPVPMSPERVELLRSLGVTLPDRYNKAHPAEDTPEASGTPSESAPAEDDNNTSSED